MLDKGVSAQRGQARAKKQNHYLQQAGSAWSHGRARIVGRRGQETVMISVAKKKCSFIQHCIFLLSIPLPLPFAAGFLHSSAFPLFFSSVLLKESPNKKSSLHLRAQANSLKEPAFEFWAQRSHYLSGLSICHYMKCTLTHL